MEHDFSEAERGSESRPTAAHEKPEPDRTQPIRNWSGIFEAGDEVPGSGVRTGDSATAPADSPQEQVGSARAGAAAGYRVIEDYLQQGRRAARDFWSSQVGGSQPPQAGGEAAEPTPAAAPDVSRLGERWLRSLGEFGANWLELMQAVSRATPPAPASDADEPSAGPFAVGHAQVGAEDLPSSRTPVSPKARPISKIVVAVSAPRPVEFYVSLDDADTSGELVVGPLGDPAGELPMIRGIKLAVSVDARSLEQRIRIEAMLDAEQPSGTYHGVVLAVGRSQPIGTLSLCLS